MTTATKTSAPRTTTDKTPDLGNLVISKLLAKGAATPTTPGVYGVRGTVTLEIDAKVSRLEDGEYTPTADIPLLATMAILLARAGITREASARLIIEAATQAVATGGKVGDELADRVEDAEEAIALLKVNLGKNLPKKSRRGQTRVTGDIKLVSSQTTTTANI